MNKLASIRFPKPLIIFEGDIVIECLVSKADFESLDEMVQKGRFTGKNKQLVFKVILQNENSPTEEIIITNLKAPVEFQR